MTTKSPSSCAIYVRRSSSKDVGLNHSLREQETACRELATRMGLDVVRVYEEREGTGASSRSRKARPRWDAALADLDTGEDFETLLVWSLDRADRRGADTVASLLTRHAASGRRIVSVDGLDTSDERQRLAIILRAEIAREEAENTAKRVARTKASRRSAGSWLGGPPPFGLQIVESKLDHDPETAPLARRIADAILAGRSLWAISRDLNAEGIPSPRGSEWRTPMLSQLVRSPGFAGLQSIRDRNPDGSWPYLARPYIDPETKQTVSVGRGIITPTERAIILSKLAERTAERSRGVVRGKKPNRTLTGALLRCAACAGRSASAAGPNGGSYRCAAMAGGGECAAPFTAPRPGVDEFLSSAFLRRLAAMEPDDARLHAIAERWAGRQDPANAEERAAAEALVEAAEGDLARVRKLAVRGLLTEDEVAEELPELRRMLASARSELAALPSAVVDVSPLLDLSQSAEAWEALPIDERRALLGMTIDHVDVKRARARGVRFDPLDRLAVHWMD